MTSRTLESPSLKKGMLQLGFISLLNLIFPILVLAYVSRHLGPAPLGAFYLYNGLLGWFLLLADFGVSLHASRELAELRHNPVAFASAFRSLKKLQFIASFAAFLIFETIVSWVPLFHGHQTVGWVLGCCLLSVPLTHDWLFQSQERFRGMVLRSILTKVFSLAGIFVFVHGPENLTAYAVIIAATAFVYTLPTLPEAWRLWKSAKPSPWASHWKSASLLLASALTVSLYIHLDSVWLGLLANAEAVGIYNAGLRVAKLAALVLTSGSMAVVVRLAAFQAVAKAEESVAVLQKTLAYTFVVMVPAAALIAILAPDIVALLYGPQFAAAAPILRLSSLQVLGIGFSNYLGMQVLLHRKREGWIFISTALAAIIGLSITWSFAPPLGAMGAAWGSLSAEVVVAVIEFILVAKLYPEIPLWPKRTWAFAISYAVAGCVAVGLQMVSVHLPLLMRLMVVPLFSFATLLIGLRIGREPLTLWMLDYGRRKVFRQT